MCKPLSVFVFFLAVWAQIVAAQTPTTLDESFGDVKSMILAGDYHEASLAIAELRKQIGAKSVPVDFRAVHDQTNDPKVVVASEEIQIAEDKYHAGDVTGTARALDIARGIATKLYLSTPPQTRFNYARIAVEKEAAAHGEAKPWTLQHAATQAYKAGLLADSIAYANRVINAATGKKEYGLLEHQAHTLLGLDYAAQGDDQRAAEELADSLKVPLDAAFYYAGPSMALAKQLAGTQRTAVLNYLDACAKLNWKDKAKSAGWKASLESGQIPDFGAQAKLP